MNARNDEIRRVLDRRSSGQAGVFAESDVLARAAELGDGDPQVTLAFGSAAAAFERIALIVPGPLIERVDIDGPARNRLSIGVCITDRRQPRFCCLSEVQVRLPGAEEPTLQRMGVEMFDRLDDAIARHSERVDAFEQDPDSAVVDGALLTRQRVLAVLR